MRTMNTIELPIIDAASSPTEVWSALHDRKRSAAIYFDRPGVPRIVFSRDVVKAMRTHADDIRRAHFAPVWLIRPRSIALGVPRPPIEAPHVSRAVRMLRRRPFSIGVLQAHHDT